jgi:hypothetical protein
MAKDIFNKCIATGMMHLDRWQFFTHFLIVGFLCIIPFVIILFHISDFIENGKTQFKEGEVWFIVVATLLSYLTYRLQKGRLKFHLAQSTLDRKQLNKVIGDVAQELKWVTMSSHKDVYTAKTFPGFFSGSWGEHITILFYENKVLVNSICDPDSRSSITSFGRNRKNVQTLLSRISATNMIAENHIEPTT